ncbi:transcriptional regulator [Planomonospora sphaerica]|uniref:Transcriptional regulator n=1 Tax=Planomonospora sphaerica TaxID=161355 RepID=A0A161LP24_9ACTN|nr:helix-turn-helix domain-containing protein [Planomonospora sphaerica]GAT67786.1 transcriptional regulator [Planomonospora sphaerica]
MDLTLYRSDKLFYRPKEAAVVLGMSRTAVFRLIKTGELQSVKRDGYRLIHVEALQEFARALVEAAESSPARAA